MMHARVLTRASFPRHLPALSQRKRLSLYSMSMKESLCFMKVSDLDKNSTVLYKRRLYPSDNCAGRGFARRIDNVFLLITNNAIPPYFCLSLVFAKSGSFSFQQILVTYDLH